MIDFIVSEYFELVHGVKSLDVRKELSRRNGETDPDQCGTDCVDGSHFSVSTYGISKFSSSELKIVSSFLILLGHSVGRGDVELVANVNCLIRSHCIRQSYIRMIYSVNGWLSIILTMSKYMECSWRVKYSSSIWICSTPRKCNPNVIVLV